MKTGLMSFAFAGMLSYNAMAAFDTVRTMVEDVNNIYATAGNINFFAPPEVRQPQIEAFLNNAEVTLEPIEVAVVNIPTTAAPNDVIIEFQTLIIR